MQFKIPYSRQDQAPSFECCWTVDVADYVGQVDVYTIYQKLEEAIWKDLEAIDFHTRRALDAAQGIAKYNAELETETYG